MAVACLTDRLLYQHQLLFWAVPDRGASYKYLIDLVVAVSDVMWRDAVQHTIHFDSDMNASHTLTVSSVCEARAPLDRSTGLALDASGLSSAEC